MTKRKFRLSVCRSPLLTNRNRIVARIEELQARSRRAREALETVPDLLEQLRQSLLAAAFRGDLTKEWRKKNPNVEPASELLKRIRAERRKKWEEAELEKLKAKGLIGERLDEEFSKRRKQYKEPVPVDATGLPDLPGGWCLASAEELTQIITDGEHQTPPRSSSGIPLLSARNIQNGYLSLEEVDYVPEAVYETIRKRLEVEAGDVLMSCSGSLGRTSVIEEWARFAMVRSVALLRPVLTQWVNFFLTESCRRFCKRKLIPRRRKQLRQTFSRVRLKRSFFPCQVCRNRKESAKSLPMH